jgi:hypothetical protein
VKQEVLYPLLRRAGTTLLVILALRYGLPRKPRPLPEVERIYISELSNEQLHNAVLR